MSKLIPDIHCKGYILPRCSCRYMVALRSRRRRGGHRYKKQVPSSQGHRYQV